MDDQQQDQEPLEEQTAENIQEPQADVNEDDCESPIETSCPSSDEAPLESNPPMDTPDETSVEKDIVPTQEVFVVRCEREEINNDCIAILKDLRISPIILNDLNEIRSIREILAQYPRCRFALIILSGDDFIYDRLTGKPGEALLGAKQNAVFYLGYLLSYLGSQGTMAIYKDQKSFRLPTGWQNAAFVPYQKDGSWQEILKSKLSKAQIC